MYQANYENLPKKLTRKLKQRNRKFRQMLRKSHILVWKRFYQA